ncbi:ATP-binding cassette domain-containing protein [Pyrobaculum ferrireducens]|uniref:Sulfate transport system, ATP-binding protein, putative n=1 Tax=Pyrobaculum ferrireducens TaxID=1104324 RepID=G7VB45_9CREN|nr:ATP-binding cassette domain-containing protein [Pyrobaculum ferrireducens]AET32355.1 sulfate transport system, ATP-binding protein, putative [Pyrobaculum ferrireducens]
MIRAVDLGKRYGDYVFRHVNVELPERGLVALVGPNGSGKTTLLKIFAMLTEPTEGEVYIMGTPWREARARHRGDVLYSHQEPLVYSGTVEDNLVCNDGDVVDALGLRPLLRHKAKSLSGGYKKLVTVARVLACRPKAALLDEPTAYLDPEKRRRLLDYVAQYAKKALVVWTTHYPPEAENSDALYEMRDGALRRVR